MFLEDWRGRIDALSSRLQDWKPQACRKAQIWRILLLATYGLAVLVGGFILFHFTPGDTFLYPRCTLFAVTGLQCPGCGGLRATHSLLHGQMRAAFQFNPLVFVLLPLLLGFLLGHSYQLVTGRPVSHPFRHPAWIWTLLALCLLFGVARNL